jgi:transposase, IS30 family
MPAYTRLTCQQRYTIEAMNRKKSPQKDIAATIGVSPSTISRELRRRGMTKEKYCHITAQHHADSHPWQGGRIAPELWEKVETKLRTEQWSPEQISQTFAKTDVGKVSHEAIYQHIYRDQQTGGGLHKHLRHRCKSYRKRGLGRERRGRIKNQVMIDERPPIVEERSRVGDWELDTIIGRPGGKVLVTMVERKSRYTFIGLAENKEAEEVTLKILTALTEHRQKVETMTFDNGKEFALHEHLAEILDAKTYFAHPYHSWERGLNENTNGLIRQYFRKGSSFDELTIEDVKRVETLLNTRPRKCLDYQTPNDIFHPPPPIALAA